jgi:hypothetical protein
MIAAQMLKESTAFQWIEEMPTNGADLGGSKVGSSPVPCHYLATSEGLNGALTSFKWELRL